MIERQVKDLCHLFKSKFWNVSVVVLNLMKTEKYSLLPFGKVFRMLLELFQKAFFQHGLINYNFIKLTKYL